eukprot:jgi/Phyca11/16778/fgenesh1_pg.PHYCAscaffold_22_\
MVGNFSVEQKNRVTISEDVASNPSILFLDELASGLDASSGLARYNPATYLQEVIGAGIGRGVKDYAVEYKNIPALKEAIKTEKKSIMANFPAEDLQLFIAKKENTR